jgi:hypothetical protein
MIPDTLLFPAPFRVFLRELLEVCSDGYNVCSVLMVFEDPLKLFYLLSLALIVRK